MEDIINLPLYSEEQSPVPAKRKVGPMIWALLLCIVSWGMTSCGSAEQHVDRQNTDHRIDSLRANGGHGYYVATYLVGRYKTSRLNTTPFGAIVYQMDEQLIGSAIVVRVLDTVRYQVNYDLDGRAIALIGEFDKELANPSFDMRIPRGELSANAIRNMTNMDYELRVYKY